MKILILSHINNDTSLVPSIFYRGQWILISVYNSLPNLFIRNDACNKTMSKVKN